MILGNLIKQEYNQIVSESAETHNFPNIDRISVLSATILLAYALSRFVDIPERDFSLQLPGIFLNVQFNSRTLITALVAALTASGADWLLRDHPTLGDKRTLQHLLLPALTALVLGFPITQMPVGPLWWLGFVIVGVILILVLIAEYIVVDPSDTLFPLATIGLTAISFALFLALVFSLRNAGARLFLILPAVAAAAWLISLRTMNLRLQEKWAYKLAGVVALISTQLAAAFHYWPVSPVTYGLLILGPTYSITSLLTNLEEGNTLRQAIIEPAIVLLIVICVAIFLG